MPRVGPGGDNVTGDRYTLDLGVEPDLGNLLQNLQVANDYLDQAEQRFRTINDVVGNTTQRLAAATRQTQLLAAETQRLQNSYAAIAATSLAAPMAGGGGGAPGMIPGQMQLAGFATGPTGNTIQTQPTTNFQDENAGGYHGGQSANIAPQHLPDMSLMNLEAGRELLKSIFGGRGGVVDKFGRAWRETKGQGDGGGGGIPTIPGQGTLAGMASGGGKMMGFARFAAKATPWLAAGSYAIKKGYDKWADVQAESRRIAGLTGGEAGLAGAFGTGNIPGSLSLGVRSRFMGLVHPGIDYGEIQDRALGAGYVQGQGYDQVRDYLFEAYKRGLGTTIDQMDLYKEAVDKAGGSTAQLVNAMDGLRGVAQTTNASIDVLMGNMKGQVESLTRLGMGGGSAIYNATLGSGAFAQAPLGSLSPNIREAGGYQLGAPYAQAQFAAQAGIPFGSISPFLATTPGVNVNVVGERVANQLLRQHLGFRPGMSFEELNDQVAARGLGAPGMLGDFLNQLGILPQNLDPTDYTAIMQWIWTTLNERPQAAADRRARESMQGVSVVNRPYEGIRGGRGMAGLSRGQSYVQSMGLDITGGHGEKLADYFSRKGARTSPVLEAMLKGDPNTHNKYVKTASGRIINMETWMNQAPDWQGALESGRVQIATAEADVQKAIDERGVKEVAASGALRFNTPQEEMLGGKGSERIKEEGDKVELGDNTITQLGEEFARRLDQVL